MEVSRFNSSEDLLKSGGISIEALDRAAHGFSVDDIKTLLPNQLNIKWKDDYENVIYEVQRGAERNNIPFNKYKVIWSKRVNLTEPIEVAFERGKFYIEDGHHRYFAAKTLGLPLNVDLTIKMNPIKVLSKLSYDDFHRCVFKQVKEN